MSRTGSQTMFTPGALLMEFAKRKWLSVAGLVLAVSTIPLVVVGSSYWGGFRTNIPLEVSEGELLALSHPSGFYQGSIDVQVSSATDAEVYYTLDGSFPDPALNPESTQTYTGAIVIDAATSPLRHSLVDHILSESGRPEPSPNTVDETATVLRIRAHNGPETVATYFVDSFADIDIPITSLIIEPDYLFDDESGIYVAGRRWQELVESAESSGEVAEQDDDVSANFFGRTDEWERPFPEGSDNPVWVDWTRQPGETWQASQAGIRIHGAGNRTAAQKSFRLYARSEYGSSRFSQDFFPDNEWGFPKRLILRTGGPDDPVAKLRDSYLQRLGAPLKVDYQRSQPTALFINGEYWGLYFVRDRYDGRYFEQRFGVNPRSVSIVDHELLVQEGADDAAEPLRTLFRALVDLPLGSDEAVALIEREVDIESLFDYVVIETFTTNRDWPRNNVLLWRTSDSSRDPMAEGSVWRYLLKDIDHGAPDLDTLSEDSISAIVALPEPYLAREDAGIRLMMRHLLNNAPYREQFFERYRDVLNSDLAPDTTLPLLEQMASEIESEVVRDRQRWQGITEADAPDVRDGWREAIDVLAEFIRQRPAVVSELLDTFEEDLVNGVYQEWPEGVRRE